MPRRNDTDQRNAFDLLTAEAQKLADKDGKNAERFLYDVKKLSLPYSKSREKILSDGDFIIYREDVTDRRSSALVGLGDGLIVELYEP